MEPLGVTVAIVTALVVAVVALPATLSIEFSRAAGMMLALSIVLALACGVIAYTAGFVYVYSAAVLAVTLILSVTAVAHRHRLAQ